MNPPNDFSANGEIGSAPDLIRSKEYSFGLPLVWLFLFATFGFMFYESVQSFLSTGRIWPAIFILVLFLLLVRSCFEIKQRKHYAAFLETHRVSPGIKNAIEKRYPHLPHDQLA